MFDKSWSPARPVALSALLMVLVLAACAGSTEPAGPDTGVVSSGPLPNPSGSPAPLPGPNRVSPEPAIQLHRERWTEVTPGADARQLLVHGNLTGGPPCAVIGRIDVEELTHQVTVTVWVGQRPGADCSGPQPDLGYPYVATVTLREPLEQRPVRDGAA